RGRDQFVPDEPGLKVTGAMPRILTGPPTKRAVQREAFQSLANALAAGGQSAHHPQLFTCGE
ncbi:hypothetical protein, partial [Xanthomonas fragariae]|uniref:hypothetical protein n=1 Tax=Xanthomonas fragariae TaxID=48664 RepID=UPI001F284C76